MSTADLLATWLNNFSALVDEHKDYLTQLDAAIGDADHGANMARGMKAVVAAIDPSESASAMLKKTGMTLLGNVGGASGPLFGTLFLKMAATIGDDEELTADALATAFKAGVDGVKTRGKAEAGEKTMLDALLPAQEALDDALAGGASLSDAVQQMAKAADEGRAATEQMKATKGRASYQGDNSIGHLDPGATTVSYLLQALVAAVD